VTRDIYWRDPRGLQQLARAHAGETGIMVHGWYNRLRGWRSALGWNAITVRVDGTPRTVLYQFKPGPIWIALSSGVHVVDFGGGGRQLHSEWVKLARGEALMIAFKPRERIPFRRMPTDEQWSLRELW